MSLIKIDTEPVRPDDIRQDLSFSLYRAGLLRKTPLDVDEYCYDHELQAHLRVVGDENGNRYTVKKPAHLLNSVSSLYRKHHKPWGIHTTQIQAPTQSHLFRMKHMLSHISKPEEPVIGITTLTPLVAHQHPGPQINIESYKRNWLGVLQFGNKGLWMELIPNDAAAPTLIVTMGTPVEVPSADLCLSLRYFDKTNDIPFLELSKGIHSMLSVPIYPIHPVPIAGTLAQYYLGDDEPYYFDPLGMYQEITHGWETHK